MIGHLLKIGVIPPIARADTSRGVNNTRRCASKRINTAGAKEAPR